MKDKDYYKIEITANSLEQKINGQMIFNASIKCDFLLYEYKILDQISGEVYKLKYFKHSIFYYGEEKIELYNAQGEILIVFDFCFCNGFLFEHANLVERNKNISFTNPEKKLLAYKEGGKEIEGYYEYVPGTSEYTYVFSSIETIEKPFHLLINCFCHKILLRPDCA